MLQCFYEHGKGWRDLALSKSVAAALSPGDLVLNLNYDTVFELALLQANRPFAYSPNIPTADQLLVCKPHGSLNMVSNDESFTFGQPGWLGMPEPKGLRSYSGLIPPHLNKSYSHHWIAQMILEPAVARQPEQITLWGVGLTESDVELVELYKAWAARAKQIEVINPSPEVVERVRALVPCNVRHFPSVAEWERNRC
jgi:hypothetical protein